MESSCTFCQIVRGKASSYKVFEDDISIAFLDSKPLFPGHVLLVPKSHIGILPELPEKLLAEFFSTVKMLSIAVPNAMEAQGSFVAINNTVSQSVPHLHVHIVPRNKGDGLKGFFWPRQRYMNNEILQKVKNAIVEAIKQL